MEAPVLHLQHYHACSTALLSSQDKDASFPTCPFASSLVHPPSFTASHSPLNLGIRIASESLPHLPRASIDRSLVARPTVATLSLLLTQHCAAPWCCLERVHLLVSLSEWQPHKSLPKELAPVNQIRAAQRPSLANKSRVAPY